MRFVTFSSVLERKAPTRAGETGNCRGHKFSGTIDRISFEGDNIPRHGIVYSRVIKMISLPGEHVEHPFGDEH